MAETTAIIHKSGGRSSSLTESMWGAAGSRSGSESGRSEGKIGARTGKSVTVEGEGVKRSERLRRKTMSGGTGGGGGLEVSVGEAVR